MTICNSNFLVIISRQHQIALIGFYFRGQCAFAVMYDKERKELRVATQEVRL